MIKERFNKLKGKVDGNKLAEISFSLCLNFGWDYYTLQKQPIPFVITMMEQLQKKEEAERQRMK